jgi:hypothetical protein
MNITPYPLSHYTALLNAGQPFSFARYGDGEWLSILGATGQNCDGHPYTPGLARELGEAVTSAADYTFASRVTAQIRDQVVRWCKLNNVDREWHSTEVFLEASLAGKLKPLVFALRMRYVGYVGPEHLLHFANDEFNVVGFAPIPKVNAYGEIAGMVRDALGLVDLGADTLLISAGPAANALIHRLHPRIGKRVTMIDVGSVFDPYVGVLSRSYAKRGGYDFTKLYKVNFR